MNKVKLEIQEIHSKLTINQDGATLLTEALNILFTKRLKSPNFKNLHEKQNYLRDLIHLIYPISKVGRYCTIDQNAMLNEVNNLKNK